MYPLAKIFFTEGYKITGSDNNETVTLDAIRKMRNVRGEGIKVFMGHNPENINGADLIIYSSAISKDNPELAAASLKNIETRDRAELLGLLTSRHDKAVCIVGTHGKTTVTSMLTHILLAAGLDISAFVGGKLKILDGSSRIGSSGIMVAEACEFNNNFLKLDPNITIVLNIDQDHMDYFKTMDNLISSFSKFCDMTSDLLVINGDDENTRKAVRNSKFETFLEAGALPDAKNLNGNPTAHTSFSGGEIVSDGTAVEKKVITFGTESGNDYYPRNIKKISVPDRKSAFESSFELWHKGKFLTEIIISVPGEHNILNAVAACAAGIYLGADTDALKAGLCGFQGAGRRFERIYDKNGITVVDDYAHHPAEIEATLKTAKSMRFKRVWAVHQPFTYSRTKALLDEFALALSIADKVILSDIMGGREADNGIVKSEDLADKIKSADVIHNFVEIAEYAAQNAESGDLIITMGCGDVDKAARLIAEKLENDTRLT